MTKYSISIPMYNAEKYIEQYIISIKNQKFTNYECIIIDDESKDESVFVVKNLIKNDSRFHIYSQRNLGVCPIKEAKKHNN